jgi:hypothetical protein
MFLDITCERAMSFYFLISFDVQDPYPERFPMRLWKHTTRCKENVIDSGGDWSTIVIFVFASF